VSTTSIGGSFGLERGGARAPGLQDARGHAGGYS
jgi:hypothetical protein